MSGLDVRALQDKDKEKELEHAPAPQVRQELRVYIAEDAFDHAVERGGADTTREVGGILVGQALRDDNGAYVRVDATIDALHAEEKGAELTFTHATWEHINKELDTNFAGKRVVGWWHTHPGFGVFLSDRDQFIHRSFFDLPFQIALVYDPKSREHGLFTWRDNEPWRCRRYFIGQREHTWDAPRTPQGKEKIEPKSAKERVLEAAGDDERPRPATATAPDAEPAADWTMLALAGVIGLVVGGMAGWFMAPRGAANPSNADDLRAEGAAELARRIDSDLVAVVRDSLGDESARRPVEDALAALDTAIRALEPQAQATPALAEPLDKLRAAYRRVQTTLQSRARAERMLALLDQPGRIDTADLVRELHMLHRATALLYGEQAMAVARTDPKRALALLQTAARLDPSNFARFQHLATQINKDAKLDPGPPATPGLRPTDAPSPSPAPAPPSPAAPTAPAPETPAAPTPATPAPSPGTAPPTAPAPAPTRAPSTAAPTKDATR